MKLNNVLDFSKLSTEDFEFLWEHKDDITLLLVEKNATIKSLLLISLNI